MAHIKRHAPHVPVILDAKRGDIGATAEQYAREAFERYQADAVTLSPFMGRDSVEPYLRYADKGAFLLCRTSNPGGDDLADAAPGRRARPAAPVRAPGRAGPGRLERQRPGWAWWSARPHPKEIERVRELAPTLPLLIPGVGAQGGDAAATVAAG